MLILSVFVLLYGISFYFSEKLSEVIGISHIVTVFTTSVCLFLLFFLFKKDNLRKYGVCIPIDIQKVQFIIVALLIIPIINVCFYFRSIIKSPICWRFFISFLMILYASFFEELLFRGILPVKITEELGIGQKTGTFLSNVIFSALHIGSLHNTGILTIFMRLFIVFSIGSCFSALKDRTHSVIPGFIIHFLINISYFDYGYTSYVYKLILIILAILYFIYDMYFYRTKEAVK